MQVEVKMVCIVWCGARVGGAESLKMYNEIKTLFADVSCKIRARVLLLGLRGGQTDKSGPVTARTGAMGMR